MYPEGAGVQPCAANAEGTETNSIATDIKLVILPNSVRWGWQNNLILVEVF